jgi:hypothetical protein
VRDRFHLDPSRTGRYQRLGCHSGYQLMPTRQRPCGDIGTSSIRSQSDGESSRAQSRELFQAARRSRSMVGTPTGTRKSVGSVPK